MAPRPFCTSLVGGDHHSDAALLGIAWQLIATAISQRTSVKAPWRSRGSLLFPGPCDASRRFQPTGRQQSCPECLNLQVAILKLPVKIATIEGSGFLWELKICFLLHLIWAKQHSPTQICSGHLWSCIISVTGIEHIASKI